MNIQSLWAATAEPAVPLPSLQGERQCDVVIIGGGYTGLSAARHIADSGREPVVLEANSLASGASGRNGGVVSPKFRVSFQSVMQRYDRDTALHLYRTGYAAVDSVIETVESLGLGEARLTLKGHLAAAHNDKALEGLQATAAWIQRETGGRSSVMLSAAEVAQMTGSQRFTGGMLTAKAGGLHPLNFARGMARHLTERGVKVFVDSPAQRVQSSPAGIVVDTPQGRVHAKQLVYATNAYSDLTPVSAPLHRRIVPFCSAIIATEPLPPAVLASLLPGGQVCGDTKRMLRWFRVIGDRLVFGGRGAFGKDGNDAAYQALQDNMVEIFPQLRGQAIAYRWSGLVDMTLDGLPHAGQLDERCFYAIGYNGGGVAMSTYMGARLAELTAGRPLDLRLLAGERLNPIPLHAFRAPGVRLAAGWQQFLDAIGR
ncbi:NAD(P)/FAD-dependent oxidoreductase [Pseudomonas putida]|uniref:NAD(P)/FAD-dependent oxidoreductase n=1 Tax=Pseudomonas putida TaxID=303 RepID=UPI00140546E2|nr:FAD-binding oxidoreductase [Pseudomonas putida]